MGVANRLGVVRSLRAYWSGAEQLIRKGKSAT